MSDQHQPSDPGHSLVLNLDQRLNLLALQETVQLLVQLLDLPDVRPHARHLAQRALLRIHYFLRHSGLSRDLDPSVMRYLNAFRQEHLARSLDQCLDRLQDLSRHHRPE